MVTTRKDTCELQTPTVGEARMIEACDKFCALDGKKITLPLLMGNMAYGFNQEQMKDICTVEDGITLDHTELAECRFKRRPTPIASSMVDGYISRNGYGGRGCEGGSEAAM